LPLDFRAPYLGVHYPGDVLIGWVIGLLIAFVAIKRADKISDGWNKLSYKYQVVIAVASSLIFWLATIAINGWRIDGQPRAFLGYAGFLTGIVVGRPIELSTVDFDPRSSKLLAKMLRFALSVAMVLVALFLLDKVFRAIADDFSALGYMLEFVRYIIAGVVSIFVAPLVFTKMRLAETNTVAPAEAASRLHLAL